ncbi:MAG TPA: acyl-CoA synthetase FdrA [Burkholderiales bacterium]|nr:acyl-CoA synthetase FdrA [Burkholderiales bacterium]
MRVSRRVGALSGVEAAALMIGTPSNKALLRNAGLLSAEGERAEPNDLIIAVRGSGSSKAVDAALAMLAEKPAETADLRRASSLRRALELEPQANLALISVPGEFAAAEARAALERGLNALVFSDNVPIEDEVALKRLAREKNLLLMGPDCGTALIGGAPLAFANVVPRGDIGIVSASGTGLQEVSTLIARMGGGVSHGIGVGGRDLDERVGALGMLSALDLLDDDAGTRTLVLISKPPAPAVARTVLERLRRSKKRAVVCFLGSQEQGLARTLTEAAEQAMQRKLEASPVAAPVRAKGRVRGLYCGGTLAAEAELLLGDAGECIDLGDDEFTRGRPHPMIEPELRNEHIRTAVGDPQVGVLLFDLVLGFGAHADPAGVLIAGLEGNRKPVVASVTGTERDPQGWSRQVAALRAAGVHVAASNAHAAAFAAALRAG